MVTTRRRGAVIFLVCVRGVCVAGAAVLGLICLLTLVGLL